MNISDKIDEIRQKPEHIRLRYVMAMVAISMIFIIAIWIFSLKDSFQAAKSDSPNIESQFQGATESLPSIKDLMDKSSQSINEGIKASQNNNTDSNNQ